MSPIPEIIASDWINTPTPLSLAGQRGKIVVVEAFQMLCPGCVAHGLPLAQSIQRYFPEDSVQVLGLHAVFEHHTAMQKHALEAFAHEYRLTFPIAIDAPAAAGPIPQTMKTWGLRGTPSLLILDQDGMLIAHHFGEVSQLVVGAQIGAALVGLAKRPSKGAMSPGLCDQDGCTPASEAL